MGGLRRGLRALRFSTVVCVATAGALALSVPVWTPTAEAQPSRADEAKARYLKGVELHDEGDYQSALIEFRRSYELVPNFNVLFNIGQEYYQLADYANALRTFQQYFDEGGKRIPPNRREQVERDIDKLKSRVATVNIKTNVAGAELRVDDQLVQIAIPGPVMMSAGKRRIEVSKRGFRTVSRTEELAGQESRDLVFELVPEATVGQDGNNKPIVIIGDRQVGARDEGPPVAPIVMWSLTGGFVIAAGVFGGLALANQGKLDDMKREPNHTEAELDESGKNVRNMAIACDVFLGASLIGAGLSIYFTVDSVMASDQRAPRGPQPMPAPRPTAKIGFGPGRVDFAQTF